MQYPAVKQPFAHHLLPLQAPIHKRVPRQHLRIPGGAAVPESERGPPAHHRQLQVAAGEAGETPLTSQRVFFTRGRDTGDLWIFTTCLTEETN